MRLGLHRVDGLPNRTRKTSPLVPSPRKPRSCHEVSPQRERSAFQRVCNIQVQDPYMIVKTESDLTPLSPGSC